jgi:hypothetical protein
MTFSSAAVAWLNHGSEFGAICERHSGNLRRQDRLPESISSNLVPQILLHQHISTSTVQTTVPSPSTARAAGIPAQKLFFTDLPAEIRNIIYEYALPAGQCFVGSNTGVLYKPTHISSNMHLLPGILPVSRRIRAETAPIFYSTKQIQDPYPD